MGIATHRNRARRGAKKTYQASERVFRQFCQNSSIHGVKYIVDEESHWLERIAWILVFCAGVGFSAYFCYQMWIKSPILMSLETTRYPLENIPFPAVSFCNVNKVSRRRLEVVLADDPRFDNVTFETMQRTLRYMTKLDRAIDREQDLAALSAMYREANVTPADLFQILKNTAPTCNDIVLDCSWQGLPTKAACWDYLSFLPTDDGFCCIFNGANYSDPQLGISSSPHEPLIVGGNGYRQGLSLVLDAQVEDYSVTNGKYNGFKVLVHATQKFPDVADRGFVIGPGSEVFAGVRGTSADTAQEVATHVTAKDRNCRAEGERGSLSYFPRYSQSGCIIECATHLMYKTYKCRPYFLRSVEGTPLCDMELYTNISAIYEAVRANPDKPEYECDCPPPCTDEWFEPEISSAVFPGHGFNLSRTFKRLVKKIDVSSVDVEDNPYFKQNVAILHVYYKDRTGVRYKTDIRFGIEDFISAMGGLLGLGLGVSVVSLIELLYFMFLRCFCHSRYSGSTRSLEMDEPPTVSLSLRALNSNQIHPVRQQSDDSAKKRLPDPDVESGRY